MTCNVSVFLRYMVLASTLALGGMARAQSFSLETSVSPRTGGYGYQYTLSYDQTGTDLPLTGNIWQWSIFLEPNTPEPTSITSPAGWATSYNPETGEFSWHTEGPQGWAMGDFGANAIAPGGGLTGFGFFTNVPPGRSTAITYDTAFNKDANGATLPSPLAGDIDGGGTFDLGDVVFALRISSGLQPSDLLSYSRADRDGDGTVTLTDVGYLLRQLRGS